MVVQLFNHFLLKENSELKTELNEIKVTKYLLISKYYRERNEDRVPI